MITPVDIETKAFGRAVNGYKKEDVDNFLNLIMVDLDNLLKERDRLAGENKKLLAQFKVMKNNEEAVIDTLNSAKKLMNDISSSAEKRADMLVQNAEMEAKSITKDAKDSISRMTEEAEVLKEKILRFKKAYYKLLSEELGRVEDGTADILAQIEKDFLPASLEETLKEDFLKDLGDNRKTRVI